MRYLTLLSIAALARAATNSTSVSSLANICTTSYIQSSLPATGTFSGITIDSTSVTANAVYNASSTGQTFYPDTSSYAYCNVTFAYSHDGLSDRVLVEFWLPAPADFQNRYLSTGGGGMAVNSGSTPLPGGIMYGAVAGLTDGGFGSFTTNFDTVLLLANGTVNWPSLYMFAYQAHHELSLVGKQLTKNIYSMGSSKLYSYYQGCSEGGREGFSQVQRYGDEFDGAIIGAPAFRFSFQQVQHLYSGIVEQTLNYAPPQCELDEMANLIIAACDVLDGKADGVVSRSDLCKLNFDLSSMIGSPYYCAASAGRFGGAATPAQNGTITTQGVAVAKEILAGLSDSDGKQVYLSYQPGATFGDAATSYSSITGKWSAAPSGLGAEYVSRFLNLMDTDSFDTTNTTYDDLRDYMLQGLSMYSDSLQTDNPDLTNYMSGGGKILHFHGEQDNSVPTASSVRYYEAVRQIMYPALSYNESTSQLQDWYRLFLVPGAAHCDSNMLQPNGPFPQTNLQVMINWVEKDVVPTTLNATYPSGTQKGENAQICAWPLRPLWGAGNGTVSASNSTAIASDSTMQCVYDQKSIDSWMYTFDGVKVPVY